MRGNRGETGLGRLLAAQRSLQLLVVALALGATVSCSTANPPATAASETATEAFAGPFGIAVYGDPEESITGETPLVVIGIHGNERNAKQLAETLRGTGGVVMAPRFPTRDDPEPTSGPVWSTSGWKDGEVAVDGPAVSSFAVVDVLIREIRSTGFTGRIVLAGHSAGGQFVQRYALVGRESASSYVVANPGSYAYLDDARWHGDSLRTLAASESAECEGVNSWKYGLADRQAYVSLWSSEAARARYRAARVTYLLGDQDTHRDADLDRSCAADWQGRSRFERGTRFASLMPEHDVVVVAGVGHSSVEMFTSEGGVAVLTGTREGG